MDYHAGLSPEQKLDIVLQKVVNLSDDNSQYYNDLATMLNATSFNKEVFEILLKLKKDGFVTSNGETGYGSYSSNFDGRLFIDRGGYTAKALRDAEAAEQQRIDAARLIQLESQNSINSGRLNGLTRWLAVGTIALALIEIIKFLCDLDHGIKVFFERIL
jgi:hypothetical protein